MPGCARDQRTPSAGAVRFIDELVARVRRAGAAGELTVRVDSGFWSNDTIAALNRLDVRYTMAVRCATKGIADAIAAIPETAWVEIDYTPDGQAQVADCAYTTGKGRQHGDSPAGGSPHPAHRPSAATTVARLAAPRVPHRPRRHGRRGRPVPPSPRRGRARHPRPQRRRRARARPVRELPCQQRLAAMRGARPQPDPLDHHLRRRPRRRAVDRRSHHPHPTPRTPRPDRQPRWPTNTAAPHRLAMGEHVHHRARHAPRPAPAPG